MRASRFHGYGFFLLGLLILLSFRTSEVYAGSSGPDPFTTVSSVNLPTESMSDVAYGNNMYVAVGSYGSIIKSTDGETWISVKSLSDSSAYTGVIHPEYFSFNGVAFGSGIFVVTGSEGVILTSTDGLTWTQRTSNVSTNLSNVNYLTFNGNPSFYVHSQGKFLTSSNGLSWTSVIPTGLGGSTFLTQLTVGNGGTRLAVGDMNGVIYSTTNGITWTSIHPTTPESFPSNGTNMLTWLNNRYFYSDIGGYIWTSTDLSTFTLVGAPFKQGASPPQTNQMFNGIYDGSKYYLFGSEAPYGYGAVYTSTDGSTWTMQPFQNQFVTQNSVYTNGKYFRLGNEGLLMSPNGMDWSYKWGGTYYEVINDGTKYIAIGSQGGDGTVWTSTDLASWDKGTLSSWMAPFTAAAYGNGKYVAIGDIYQSNLTALATSNNGTAWTTGTGISDSTSLKDIAFGNGKFVAVGSGSGNVPKIKTSTDGITWSTPSLPALTIDSLYTVTYANNLFIALGNGSNVSGNIDSMSILTSTDGITWVQQSGSYPTQTDVVTNIIYDGSKYVLLGYDSTTYVVFSRSSNDLTTWSGATTISDMYAGSTSSLLGQKGSNLYTLLYDINYAPAIYYSNNQGSTWQIVPTDATLLNAFSLTDANNEIIVSGKSQLVMTTLATIQNSTISPSTGVFDKKISVQADVTTTLTLNGNTLSSITNGVDTLTPVTDYTVSGSTVTITKEYLATQPVGTTSLVFTFSAGATQTLTITVSDTTPQNSTISPSTGVFDKKTSAQADVTTTLTLNGNTLSSITNGVATLTPVTDYTVSGSTVTITKEYLATQPVGTTSMVFTFSAGVTQTLTITVSDTTLQNSTISPSTGVFDKKTSAQADVTTTLTLNGNTLSSITNGVATLTPVTDYTVSGSTVTITKEYLATQPVGTTSMVFTFSAGATQTLMITVSDTSVQNSTISPSTGVFDKKTSAQADVTTTLTLHGNTLSSISNGGATLTPVMDYTVSGSTVTIAKEYLATQPVGTTSMVFTFSAGATQTLTITVSNTTVAVPGAPVLQTAIAGNAQVSLSWAPVNGASGYKIYKSLTSSSYGSEVATVGSSVYGYDITGLNNGTMYYFIVVASNSGEDSAPSNELAASPRTVPLSPTNIVAVAGDGRATITFTAPAGNGGSVIMGYEVTDLLDNVLATGTTSPITVTGLSNGTSYTFKVKAINIAGKSVSSTVSNSVTPSEPVQPSIPTPTTPTLPPTTGVDVLVNGKVESAGTATASTVNNQTILTIAIDAKKMEERLATEGQNAVITIPVNTASDVVVGQLNGQILQKMEQKQAVIEIKTEKATYTIPANQINIQSISDQLGKDIALQDISIQIEIATPSVDTVKVVQDSAAKGKLQIVIPPLDFTVRATSGNQTFEVTKFNVYVERTIAIPDGIDPKKITTGIVIDPDGKVRHVPTKIVMIDGKYYAQVNSLTNSTYSIVWHPVEFSDVTKHWAKEAVNDMGSRMVIEGTGNDLFNPNQDITRAEFTAIIVRGLGLKLEKGTGLYTDVNSTDWYNDAIQTAASYNLINGFNDGTFRPTDKITREQAMTIIAKAMKITGLKDKLPAMDAEALLQSFVDANHASQWAKSGLTDSLQAGIVLGRSESELAPKAFITRAEVAAMIQRLLQKSDLI